MCFLFLHKQFLLCQWLFCTGTFCAQVKLVLLCRLPILCVGLTPYLWLAVLYCRSMCWDCACPFIIVRCPLCRISPGLGRSLLSGVDLISRSTSFQCCILAVIVLLFVLLSLLGHHIICSFGKCWQKYLNSVLLKVPPLSVIRSEKMFLNLLQLFFSFHRYLFKYHLVFYCLAVMPWCPACSVLLAIKVFPDRWGKHLDVSLPSIGMTTAVNWLLQHQKVLAFPVYLFAWSSWNVMW